MPTALILNTNHNDLRMIKALKQLGYDVIATGNRKGLIGDAFVDEHVYLDYSDKVAVLQLARERRVDAVCACCNDFGVLTAAYVAEHLGLPGHDSYAVASTLHRKDKFKRFARQHGIRTPLAEEFSNSKDAFEWIDQTQRFPLMVKAADLSAGNGITRVNSLGEAKCAVEAAFSASRAKTVVVEPYVRGTQHAICTFLIDQKAAAVASNNEFSFVNPYRVEIDTFPAFGFDDVRDDLVSQIESIANALHLENGIFEMQYILDEQGVPWILEGMRRILGNLYSVPASNYSGFDWDYWQARAYCGLSMDDFPRDIEPSGFYAYRSLMAPRNGVFSEVEVSNRIKPYLQSRLMLQEAGYSISNYESDPMGFLFFSFPDAQTMHRCMVEEYDNVRVLVQEVSHA